MSRLSVDGGASGRLAEAERLLRAGASVRAIRDAVRGAAASNDVEAAWLAVFADDLEAALEVSYPAADARPYDVDSRIVHGVVRLARNEL